MTLGVEKRYDVGKNETSVCMQRPRHRRWGDEEKLEAGADGGARH